MNTLLELDGQILLFIQEHIRCGALDGAMRLVSTLGNAGAIWIVTAIALLCFKRTRRFGLACGLALLLGFAVTNLALKHIIHRIRPYDVISSLNILVKPERSFSFPSGHATSSLAAGVALFLTLPRKYGAPALLLGVLIALSRLYVGVHYPTDVLCGATIGVAAALAGVRIARTPRRRAKSEFPQNS